MKMYDVDEIVRLYAEGMNSQAIGKVFGITAPTVLLALKGKGVIIRHCGGKSKIDFAKMRAFVEEQRGVYFKIIKFARSGKRLALAECLAGYVPFCGFAREFGISDVRIRIHLKNMNLKYPSMKFQQYKMFCRMSGFDARK